MTTTTATDDINERLAVVETEVRNINTRLDDMRANTNARFDEANANTNARFDEAKRQHQRPLRRNQRQPPPAQRPH